MTQAVTAPRDGHAFQARLFWLKAACLLDPDSPILRVGFETGPKGFDDIWVEYDPSRGPNDQEGRPLLREHIQCKWHVEPNSYGHAELIDPEFINAKTRSLLQRALAAQRSYAPEGGGARFRLVTNWRIDGQDPLRKLVHNRSHTLRLDRLFGTATDNSAMGGVRRLWREHLELHDDGLRLLARTLAFSEATDSLDELRDALDPLFRIAGLRRIPSNESAFIYDDVVFQWLGQGRLEFDRETLRAVCKREGLLANRGERVRTVYGVKSFEHATDKLEDRCAKVLDLVPSFDNRQICQDAGWSMTLYPILKNFLLSAAREGERLRLILDAHLTLAFAAGTVLNIKSGRTIELEQRTIGKKVWAPDDADPDPAWPSWAFETEIIGERGTDLAVSVGPTHDTGPAVRAYVVRTLPEVGILLIARPSAGPSARSVVCGRHAFDLAEALTAQIRSTRSEAGTVGQIHLFPACPGAFAFFLGQRQIAIGRLTLYEFDFEGGRDSSYQPSLSLPVNAG